MRELTFLGTRAGGGDGSARGARARWSRLAVAMGAPAASRARSRRSRSPASICTTFVADEARNGLTHFTEDAATVLKFHGSYQQDDRDLRTQLKREGKEKAFQFMVRVRIVGRQDHRRAVPGQRRPGAVGRQRHAPDHDAAGVPAPRRPQGGPADDDPPDQRDAALDPGRLRRRRAERALLPGPDPRRGPRRDAGRRRPLRLALRPQVVELLGHLARRREGRQPAPARGRPDPGPDPRRRPDRADLRQGVPPPQVQDGLRPARGQLHRRPGQRPGLPRRGRGRRARRLQRRWSAAAWARPRAPEDVPVPGRRRSATSTGTRSSRSARP